MKSTIEQVKDQAEKHREFVNRMDRLLLMDETVVTQTLEISEMYDRIKSSVDHHGIENPTHLKFFGYAEAQPHFAAHRLATITDEEANEKPWRFRSKDENDLKRHLLLLDLYDSYTYFEKNDLDEDIIDVDFLEIMNTYSQKLMDKFNTERLAA